LFLENFANRSGVDAPERRHVTKRASDAKPLSAWRRGGRRRRPPDGLERVKAGEERLLRVGDGLIFCVRDTKTAGISGKLTT
jgi:hypothetical protein